MHIALIGSLFTNKAFVLVFYGVVVISINADILLARGKLHLWFTSVVGAIIAVTVSTFSAMPYISHSFSRTIVVQTFGFAGLGAVFAAPVIGLITWRTSSYILRACLYTAAIGAMFIVAYVYEMSYTALAWLAITIAMWLGIELVAALRRHSITAR